MSNFEFKYLQGKRHPKGDDIRFKGGPGSGHEGHAGRPGSVGGSVPSNGTLNFGGSVYKVAEAFNNGDLDIKSLTFTPQKKEGTISTWIAKVDEFNIRILAGTSTEYIKTPKTRQRNPKKTTYHTKVEIMVEKPGTFSSTSLSKEFYKKIIGESNENKVKINEQKAKDWFNSNLGFDPGKLLFPRLL